MQSFKGMIGPNQVIPQQMKTKPKVDLNTLERNTNKH